MVWPEDVGSTLCSGLDSGQGRTPHLALVTSTAAFAGGQWAGLVGWASGATTLSLQPQGSGVGVRRGTIFALRQIWEPPHWVTFSNFVNFLSFSFCICKVELPWASPGARLNEGHVNGAGCRGPAAGAVSWGCWRWGPAAFLAPTLPVLLGWSVHKAQVR